MKSQLLDSEKTELLKNIRSVLAKPENWVKGVNAVLPSGHSTAYNDAKAVRFCLWGASARAGSFNGPKLIAELLNSRPISGEPEMFVLARWSDMKERRHIHVLEFLDAGIKSFDPGYTPPKMSFWAWFKSWRSRGGRKCR